jgi:hypothetical protein
MLNVIENDAPQMQSNDVHTPIGEISAGVVLFRRVVAFVALSARVGTWRCKSARAAPFSIQHGERTRTTENHGDSVPLRPPKRHTISVILRGSRSSSVLKFFLQP